MENGTLLILPDAKDLKIIRKELNEDQKRLEKKISLFKEWLKYEKHLPKNVDPFLIQTFVRSCKCDLTKSKKKFEKYLAGRIKLKRFFNIRNFDETYFKTIPVHKQLVTYPKLTPNGYRIIAYRFPEDPNEFSFEEMVRYMLAMFDFLCFNDIAAGYIFMYDMKYFTAQHLAKMKIKDVLNYTDFMHQISPWRTNAIFLIYVPFVAKAIINLAKKILTEKLRKRIHEHNDLGDLHDYVPKDILPEQYGGTGPSIDELGDRFRSYFMQGASWMEKINDLKLAGPIPANKRDLYFFEDYEMEGSFRQLNID